MTDKKYIAVNKNGLQYHITVALLLFRDDKMLIIEKSDPAYGNKYSVIAGHLEHGEDPKNAIKREAFEEIFLDVNEKDFILLNKFEGLQDTCRYGVHIHDWHIFTIDKEIDIETLIFDKSEISSLKWIEMADLEASKHIFTKGSNAMLRAMKYIV